MIQSQINRNIRLDLADAILLSKAKKDLSFAEIADGTGLAEAFVTAALLGQQALPADAARLVGAKLDLDEDSILLLQMIPLRGCIDDRIPTDPTMYRFYEMLQVYGTTLKALVHEKFGDGIISAINFKLDVKKVADPEGGELAVITLDGKYLPTKPQLRQASGMSFSVAALLTALPVVTMGGLALAGSWLHQHVSERRSVAISLLLIAVGALMRELYPQSALLLSSALLGGVGIGIIQAVMPSVIKRRFQQRTPLVMGLWSAALMGGGGLGAAITPWLVQHSETWYQTLAWWALPAVVALFAWWWQSAREVASSHKTTTTPVRVVFTPRAWTLGVYFGLINGGYASLIAWLPAFYIEIGASAQYSGSLLALMTLGQAAGALLMPAMARHQDRRKLLMLALVLQLVGFCGFIWLPMQLPVLWAMVCGLGLGGAFPLCLLLALDHSVQPAIAGKLVAFMQGIGFIIAGLAPWFSGVLRSISGNYLMDWAFHALCVVGLMIITLRFAPVRFPQLWVKEA